MNVLVSALAAIIIDKIKQAISANNESRLMFNGPNIELLELVYNELVSSEPIKDISNGNYNLPILLLNERRVISKNPEVGASGFCDESHLLQLRNDPSCSRFVALVPPGQHSTRSIESTSDEFGVATKNNTSHTSFDNWWNDEFIQHLISEAIHRANLSEQESDARKIVEYSARALDEINRGTETKDALWRLISRIFSAASAAESLNLSREEAFCLACGMPKPKGALSYKSLTSVLQQIADIFSDGFKTGRERISQQHNGDSSIIEHLDGFVFHLKDNGASFTEVERAISAFYLPTDTLIIASPPEWWDALTEESWLELLADEPSEVGDLAIECVNGISVPIKGCPTVVRDEAQLVISAKSNEAGGDVIVSFSGISGKDTQEIIVNGSTARTVSSPPSRKTAVSYKISAPGYKNASIKVLSLATWLPGLFATCRVAKKLSLPKAPRKGRANKAGASWESEVRVPGSGRYEIEVFVSPDSQISTPAKGIQDELDIAEAREVVGKKMPTGKYLFEIEVDGKYQLDIPVTRTQGDGSHHHEIFRVYVVSEDVKEEGCRSEFERLINANRSYIEKSDVKPVVQLNRNVRLSSLQSWVLEQESIESSFLPLIIAEDYGKVWAPPQWGELKGSILSEGAFLYDPRPAPDLFQPPAQFVKARRDIAERIRAVTDEQSGLVESAPLGKWLNEDISFATLIESYVESFQQWLTASPQIACWSDIIAVVPQTHDGRSLQRVPDAIILSPLHPVRLAWHCVAQRLLVTALEDGQPCPAASVLAPGQIPDIFTLSLQAPEGIVDTTYLAVESSSDYWSILWNGQKLSQIVSKAGKPPFDDVFGLTIGSISGGFSSTQVQRSLEDVAGILSAKPTINLTLSSAGGVTDSCNDGLISWCTKRFGSDGKDSSGQGLGAKFIQIFDTRDDDTHLDDAIIANLSEDTNNKVRWFKKQPKSIIPDIGIIAQLESSEPELRGTPLRSPVGAGGLLRHRIRAQLPNAFLIESRQGILAGPSGSTLEDKLVECLLTMENKSAERLGYQYAPNVIAVEDMFEKNQANFVAISSAAFDPACFSGGWLNSAYLWDYELPSYSHRAGDTSGYYLLSRINDVDKDGLAKVLKNFPECSHLGGDILEEILLEVSRRGIPTVKGLSGTHTTASGDLGVFLAVRLLQDQFRLNAIGDSLLPVIKGSPDRGANIALIVPVDPFQSYLSDLSRSISKEYKDVTLSRPDLIIVGISINGASVRMKLTPVEVKFRQGNSLSSGDIKDALGQAQAFSALLKSIQDRAASQPLWEITFQHLLLSMLGFGFRVYSNQQNFQNAGNSWSDIYQAVSVMLLSPTSDIEIDGPGRLIAIGGSADSASVDNDHDGFDETITISKEHAGRIIAGDPALFYDLVRKNVGDWRVYPQARYEENNVEAPAQKSVVVEKQPESEGMEAVTPALPLTEQPTDDAGEVQSVGSPGVILRVGHSANAFEPRELALNISNTQLNQLNIGVVGDLGTGKTQLLKSLIYQVATSTESNRGIKPRFLIFDYKKDYSNPGFVNATNAKIVKPFHLPLNLFDTSSIVETNIPWLDRFRFFADVLDKIYSGIGPVQRDKLKNAVRSAYDIAGGHGKQPTIYDIHTCYKDILGGKSDSPMAIIDDLVDMEIFTRDESKIIPFSEFLDGVVVISLDSMGQDDRSKNMVVAIMLNMFYESMLKTPKREFVGSDPQLRAIDSYLLVDEADNIMRYEFNVLRKLLLQGREFGTGVILASQYLRHFKGNVTDYKEPLLTWFIHKIPNITAQELASLGLAARLDEVVQSIKGLPNHHCLYKSYDTGGEFIVGLPFYKLMRS